MSQKKKVKCKNDDNIKENNINLKENKIFNIQKMKKSNAIFDENIKFDFSFIQNFSNKKETKKEIFEKIIKNNLDLPIDINIMDDITKLNNIYQIINKVIDNINSNDKKKKNDVKSILKKKRINKTELLNEKKRNNIINKNDSIINQINNQDNLFLTKNNLGNINQYGLYQNNLNPFTQSCDNNTNYINLLNCNMAQNENIFNNINNINLSMNDYFGVNYQNYNSNINNLINIYNNQYYIPMNNSLLESYQFNPNFFNKK